MKKYRDQEKGSGKKLGNKLKREIWEKCKIESKKKMIMDFVVKSKKKKIDWFDKLNFTEKKWFKKF